MIFLVISLVLQDMSFIYFSSFFVKLVGVSKAVLSMTAITQFVDAI